MKLPLFGLAAATLALAVCTAPLARANQVPNQVADGTYVFTATDGNTPMDGSSVTFTGDTISGWNLVDSAAPAVSGFPLNKSNSFIESSGVLGIDAWYFTIQSNDIGDQVAAYFEAQNNLFGPGVGGGTGEIFDGYGDPDGNWSPANSQGVPDASATFWLLAAGIAAIGMSGSMLGRRVTIRH